MIRYNLIGLCFGAVFFPSLALADSSVSQADQDACTPDVFRLCQEFIPDEAPIVACLEAKRVQLSPACLKVMFPPNETAPQTQPVEVARKAHHTKRKHKKPHPK